MIPRRWPVTNTHPLREINPRDRRCFRGIISFGSGSWLTRTMVHFGRRLSAFRFSLFLSSFTPSSILRLIFFCQDTQFSRLFLRMVRGWPVEPFRKRVYIGSREWEIHCFFLFFSFSIKPEESRIRLIGERMVCECCS